MKYIAHVGEDRSRRFQEVSKTGRSATQGEERLFEVKISDPNLAATGKTYWIFQDCLYEIVETDI